MQGSQLESFAWEGNEYWFKPRETPAATQRSFHLLPAFDELFVAYKDRKAYLRHRAIPQDFITNGMLRPALLHRGQVRGLWKRSVAKGSVTVAASFYGTTTGVETKQLRSAVKAFAAFLELPLGSLDIVSS